MPYAQTHLIRAGPSAKSVLLKSQEWSKLSSSCPSGVTSSWMSWFNSAHSPRHCKHLQEHSDALRPSHFAPQAPARTTLVNLFHLSCDEIHCRGMSLGVCSLPSHVLMLLNPLRSTGKEASVFGGAAVRGL